MRSLKTSLTIALLVLVPMAMAFSAAAPDPAAPQQGGTSFMHLIWAGMPVEGILILLSVVCLSLALQWTFTIKHDVLIPPGLADELHSIFAEGVSEESVENARNAVAGDNSMLGIILASAFDKKDFGYDTMRETAEQVGVAEHNKYMSKVNWLSLFSSTATLLGLLGTVTGIIRSFLSMSGNTDPAQLAAGIGEALVCTATGLIIAIIGLVFFFFLRQRVNGASLDAAVITNEVLDYFRPAK